MARLPTLNPLERRNSTRYCAWCTLLLCQAAQPWTCDPILQTASHVNSGHNAWDTMFEMTCSRCYFFNISVACRHHVAE